MSLREVCIHHCHALVSGPMSSHPYSTSSARLASFPSTTIPRPPPSVCCHTVHTQPHQTPCALMPIFRCDASGVSNSVCVLCYTPFSSLWNRIVLCRQTRWTMPEREHVNHQPHSRGSAQQLLIRWKRKKKFILYLRPIFVFIGCFSRQNSFTIWWLCEILIDGGGGIRVPAYAPAVFYFMTNLGD